MKGLDPQQVGRRTCGSGGAFSLPIHSSRIVVGVMDRAFGNLRKLSEHVILRVGASQFEITVGDVPSGVAEAHEARRDPRWET